MIKNPPANAGDVRDMGSISGLERSPREGNGNPLQYSRLENPMDRGAWHAIDHGVVRVGHDLVIKQQLMYASRCASLKNNMPRERRKILRSTYCMIPLMQSSRVGKTVVSYRFRSV